MSPDRGKSKSLKTKLAILIISAVLILVLVWEERVPVAAWFWHLRHNTISVNGYVLPVPKGWYVEKAGKDGYLLVRLHTDDATPTKRIKAHTGILVTIANRGFSQDELQHMAVLEASLLEEHGAHNISIRSVGIGHDMLVCVGGEPLRNDIVDLELESWNCKAPGGLELAITATEPDMKQVWGVLSGIHND